MKNTKALSLILVASFFLATGSAFAGALGQLQAGPFGDGRSSSVSSDNKGLGDIGAMKAAAPAASAPAPAPKPTLMESIKGFIGDNARNMLLGGIGAYIGFVLLGPVGLLIGGLLFLAAGTL